MAETTRASDPGTGTATPDAHTAPLSEFDRDTAVRRRARGEFETVIADGWSVFGAVNGGYLKAMVGRAVAETLPHPHPATVTAHYLTAPRPGPAVIRVETVREGRTLSTATASLTQTDPDGTEVERLRVLATHTDLTAGPDEVRTTAEMPDIPAYEDCVGMDLAPPEFLRDAPIVHRLAGRLDPDCVGWAVGVPSGRAGTRGWFAFADGRPVDPLALLMVGDALPPSVFDLGLSGWVPTIELTTHVRALPAPGPLRVALTTRNLAGGLLEEDGEVWDSAGRLVAQSRQLARAPRG
ncbi:thioesterase family protein [Streptomyces calidiresistens]|uniref:Thioesterase family protein n=1 Tax=Streptomyces calidiresistens TaxID=1485586 RepID=A0A7W3SZV5_9ACTN|nr:thioesterase family protein [Streptomyces calidiresistens]MBB0228280.1 thioesterase family protein [Streptomyces calidiresistens]